MFKHLRYLWESFTYFIRYGFNRKRIRSAIAAIVVFTTVYTLIMPAIALEQKNASDMAGLDLPGQVLHEYACALEAHKHTDDCYKKKAVYDADGNKTGTKKVLNCGKADWIMHTHDENCYQDGVLVCTLPEHAEHVHTDACYSTKKKLICDLPEGEEHTHTDACYTEERVLTCGESALHRHTVDCYEKGPNGESPVDMGWVSVSFDEYGNEIISGDPNHLICGQLELLAHQHSDACFIDVEMPVEEVPEVLEEQISEDQIIEEPTEQISELPEEQTEEVLYNEESQGEENADELLLNGDENAENSTSDDAIGPELIKLEEEQEADSETEPDPNQMEDIEVVTDDEAADKNVGDQGENENSATPAGERTIEVEGASYSIHVSWPEESSIPEDAEFRATAITEKRADYDAYRERALAAVDSYTTEENRRAEEMSGLFDLTIYDADGMEIQPKAPLSVSIDLGKSIANDASGIYAVHFPNTGIDTVMNALSGNPVSRAAQIVAEKVGGTAPEVIETSGTGGEVQFEAESLSVYAIVYTVDFHYEVNGQTYEYKLPGGGCITLSELVQMFGIQTDNPDTDRNEIKEFINEIENVVFSSPQLAWVGEVQEDSTVEQLKEANGLEVLYSAELTEEQISEINVQTVEAGDWALISLRPFTTEERLTVTMKDGKQFTVVVTDTQETTELDGLDANNTYIISYQDGSGYHVMKTDGTVETFANTANFDKLGSAYQWSFYYVFREKDRVDSLDYTYYFIRPAADKTKTIALNEAGEDLVQYGTNNVAIIPHGDDGFVFLGYNHTESIHIELGFENGNFVAYNDTDYLKPTDDPTVIHIYKQDPLPTYEFTVVSDDYKRGYVTTTGTALTKQAEVEQRQSDGTYKVVTQNVTYYSAETNNDKKNNYAITATAASHTNAQGQNKWEFDYWDLNGTKLEGVGATINPNTLSIPANGSVLTAHFKQKSETDYVVPDGEKNGTTIESMAAWLNELKNRNIPLDQSACNKTAEVYDYENRIYRVDFTAKSSLTTFDGTIDLGFILDVSGSMNFPSFLYDTSVVSGVKDLKTINDRDYWWQATRGEREWNLDTEHIYYIIADPDGTATVCYLYYYDNNWWLCDASKDRYTGNGRFNPADGHSADNSQYYNNSYYKSTSYVIKEAGDRVTNADMATDGALLNKLGLNVGDPKTRAFYLEKSLNGTISELNQILSVLSIANSNNQNPDVKIAWNTFRNYLPNGAGQLQHNFQSATSGINLNYDYNTYGGGTSTDAALLDAAGVNRNDINNRYSDNDRKNWDTDNNTSHTYTLNKSSGFQWDNSSTKYAVLITDGAPQRNGKSITKRYVTEASDQLKSRDVKLVTVGLGIENVTSGKILMYDIADSLNNEKMFYSAQTGDELQDVLLQIIRSIMTDATVHGDVTDTIDQAFYPVDKATGRPLHAGEIVDLEGKVTTDSSKSHGTITYEAENDKYGVKWEMQEFTWDGWHGSIYVKAKEDLLGGNAVKTNDIDAVIEAKAYSTSTDSNPIPILEHRYINNDPTQGEDPKYIKTVYRETPRVNVNELSFPGTETDWTVYLGTQVDPKEQLKKLWENILVEEVVKDGRATDTDGDGLPDTGAAGANNTWYPIEPNSIEDNREPDPEDADAVAAYGKKQTFAMNALVKNLAEASGRTEDYSWWDYNNHVPKWDAFLTQALTENGIVIPYDAYSLKENDNSTITIKLTKEILSGEEGDLINGSPHSTTVVNGTKIVDGETVDVPVEKYNLTVLYSPDYSVVPVGQGGSGTYDFHTGTYGTIYQGHAAGTETSKNIHTINVYAKTIEVEKRKPAAGDTTALLTDKPATFSLYRKWKSTDGADKKVSLAGYMLDGTTIGEPETDDDYYYLVETKQTESGIAKFTEVLSAADAPYYLAETSVPDGYAENKVLQTIIVTPGPNTTTSKTTPPVTTTEEGAVSTAMPYDWTQGVRFYFDHSETPAVYVDSDGAQIVPTAGEGARTYVLPEDAAGYFKTSVLNEPLASLQLKKQVTINDFDPAHSLVEDKTVADGTYIINVAGKEGTATAGQSYTVKITITNGAAVSATIKDNAAAGSTEAPIALNNGILEIPNLLPGEYTVTEAADSKTVLSAINSTDDGAVQNLENRKVTITLDGTASSVQLVTLTNNYADNHETDIAHVSVRKTFAGLKPGMKLPEGFNVKVKITATIDGRQQVFNYTLTGATDTENGVIWNNSVNADGDVVWDWKIAIHGLTPDAQVEVQEVNYTKPGYDVTTSANPGGAGATSYTGTVSSSTVVSGTAAVITEKNKLKFPLTDNGSTATIFIARIVPSQTSLVISKNKLNLSEKAALEAQLHNMPNAGDWYNDTVPLYYSFEDAANHKIVVRNRSEVTYSETTPGDPSTGQIVFDKKCQWDMVATVTLTYVDGRPADFNFVNSYMEKGVGIDIVKVDKDHRTTTLPGAVFTLTKLDESTKPGHVVYKKVAGTDTYERQELSDPTGDNGNTAFANLTGGYYEIKETTLPDGYVLEGDGCIYVKVEDGVAWYLAVSDDPEKPITEWDIIQQTTDGDNVQVTVGAADNQATAGSDETAKTEFSIGNTPGTSLPSTGGSGTTLLYLIGLILTGFAGAGFAMRRRGKTVR